MVVQTVIKFAMVTVFALGAVAATVAAVSSDEARANCIMGVNC